MIINSVIILLPNYEALKINPRTLSLEYSMFKRMYEIKGVSEKAIGNLLGVVLGPAVDKFLNSCIY